MARIGGERRGDSALVPVTTAVYRNIGDEIFDEPGSLMRSSTGRQAAIPAEALRAVQTTGEQMRTRAGAGMGVEAMSRDR